MESYIPPRYGRYGDQVQNEGTNPPPPGDSQTAIVSTKKYPPGFAFAKPTGFNPLPIILLFLLTSPYIETKDNSFVLKEAGTETLEENYDEEDNILDILSAIYPYMDTGAQKRINSIFGLQEAHSILKKLPDNSYRTSRLSQFDKGPIGERERLIGIIRSLQPFISLENQTIVNRILEIDDTIEKLSHRLRAFRQQDMNILNTKGQSLARLKEAMDIIKVVATPEQHRQIDGLINLIRVMETVELAQIFGTSHNDTASHRQTKSGDPYITPAEDGDRAIEDTSLTPGNTAGTLQSLLSPEQSKSLDLIIKIARLMSQANENSQSAD